MTLIALTRAVSPALADCALTFLEREPIDVSLATEQHRAYEEVLRELGAHVISLPPEPDLPDSVFVEDTAVVVEELAVLTAPLLPSRRREVASVAAALAPYRPHRFLNRDATLEGGDVLRIGRTLYVGLSARTNRAGVAGLAAALEPHGYTVRTVMLDGCLHLKSACTYIGRNTLLANRAWVDITQLGPLEVVDVAPTEPGAGNALLIGETVVLPASFPETQGRLTSRGFPVQTVDVSELQKAEAGVTCCSIVFEAIDTHESSRS